MLDLFGVPIPKPIACAGASLLVMLVTGMISAFASADDPVCPAAKPETYPESAHRALRRSP